MRSLYRSAAAEGRIRAMCEAWLDAWPCPHATQIVSTSLGDTHVVEAGDGDVVCVFLPGTSFNAATCTPLITALARRCRVVVPDLPGQPGLSAPATPADEVVAFSAWVDELLAWIRGRTDGRPIVLVGHSRGAAVALTATPDLVDRLVLLAPAGFVGAQVGIRVLWATLPWMLRPSESSAARLVRVMCGDGHRPRPELAVWMAAVARDTRMTGAPGPLSSEILARWRGRDVAALVGAADCFFRPSKLARAVTAGLGPTLTVVPDAGHLLIEEDPAGMAAAILRRGSAK